MLPIETVFRHRWRTARSSKIRCFPRATASAAMHVRLACSNFQMYSFKTAEYQIGVTLLRGSQSDVNEDSSFIRKRSASRGPRISHSAMSPHWEDFQRNRSCPTTPFAFSYAGKERPPRRGKHSELPARAYQPSFRRRMRSKVCPCTFCTW